MGVLFVTPRGGARELVAGERARRHGILGLVQSLGVAEDAAPVVYHLRRGALSRLARDLPLEGGEDDRMELQALHDRGGVLASLPREVAKELVRDPCRPLVEGADLHPRDPERRQHVAHVVAQRGREHHDQRLLGVDAGILVGEVRDPMQRHRRLPGSRRATNHDESRVRPGDERELVGIDQARDVGEMLVGAATIALQVGLEPA